MNDLDLFLARESPVRLCPPLLNPILNVFEHIMCLVLILDDLLLINFILNVEVFHDGIEHVELSPSETFGLGCCCQTLYNLLKYVAIH